MSHRSFSMLGTYPRLPRHNRGAALVVGLVLLLILTVLGVNALTTTNMETKMASNFRDRTLAFQAAETALREAEEFIENFVLLDSQFNGATSWLYNTTTGPTQFDAFNAAWWTGTASRTYQASKPSTINTTPRYTIELRGTLEDTSNTSINIMGYGASTGSGTITTYRVTARGTGRTDNSNVILQAYFAKRL